MAALTRLLILPPDTPPTSSTPSSVLLLDEPDTLRVITHSETFHADEVFGTALLMLLHQTDQVDLLRTRDSNIIDNAPQGTYVLDVGRVYNAETLRFDHHQNSFEEAYSDEFTFPMSSCGLVWKHYGEAIVRDVYGATEPADVAYSAYKDFFAGIDAGDNGVPFMMWPDTRTNYAQPMSIGFCISQFNFFDDKDKAFRLVMGIARDIIHAYLSNLVGKENSYINDIEMLAAAYDDAMEECSDIMVLPRKTGHLPRFLQDHDQTQTIKYIVVPRSDNEWQIWTVNFRHRPFDTYAPIQGEESISEGSVKFVHKNRFIAVTYSKQSAIELAQRSSALYRAWSNIPTRVMRWFFG